jgi:uncharacterized repeat protein (TIGR01451 family)
MLYLSGFSNTNRRLVVIDDGLMDRDQLIAGVLPHTTVLVLGRQEDCLNRVRDVLQQHDAIDSLHLVGHGEPGQISLGRDALNASNLLLFAEKLKAWADFLVSSSQILLYGCRTGAGIIGRRFVQDLAMLTGAEVFASKSLVGGAALGGSWDLTVSAGGDSAPSGVFTEAAQKAYRDVLATPRLVKVVDGLDLGILNGATGIGGELLFTANVGSELWISDGTDPGTVLIKNFPENIDFPPTNVNGIAYFARDDGNNGVELWKSDGTAAGTVLVSDINVGADGSFPLKRVNVNGTLFFSAFDNTSGYELWNSSGGGAFLVKDIIVGDESSDPHDLTNVNGRLFFVADDKAASEIDTVSPKLWISDGTDGGTTVVKDPTKDIINFSFLEGPIDPTKLIGVGNILFFEAGAFETGRELWRSDGTEGGTFLVQDITLGQENSDIQNLTNVNGTLFFTNADVPDPTQATLNYDLWRSDGVGAFKVDTFPSVRAGGLVSLSPPSNFTAVNNTLFFTVDDGIHGEELWKNDGGSSVLVKDINPGSVDSGPNNLVESNGTLFFVANGGIWKSDGTELGTQIVADASAFSSAPTKLRHVGGTLYFTLSNSSNELWTLENDIPNPNPSILSFSAADYSISEMGTTTTPITVIRSGSSSGEVSVTVTPSNGSATAPDDYNNAPVTVTFADGDTTPKIVNILINNDSLTEQNETVSLALTNPIGGASLGNQSTSTLTITDDDNPNSALITISNVTLEERNVNTRQWESINASPIKDTKTIDGNIIKIKPIIKNQESRDITVRVRVTETVENRDIALSKIVTIGANSNSGPELEFLWDTNGFAWGPNNFDRSARDVRITVEDVNNGNQLATQDKFIEVRPKPVILVHGLFSNYETWGEYDGFLENENPKWDSFAVGDNQAPGVIDTGLLKLKTTEENAKELDSYITGVRKNFNAEHVDIVGHSQGGLISRKYIQDEMSLSQDGKPIVNRLLMLGTPNGGAATASYLNAFFTIGSTPLFLDVPAIRELTISYLNDFNNKVKNRKGVPFSILAGINIPTLGGIQPQEGDSVVTYESATLGNGNFLGISDQYIIPGRFHLSMTGSQEDFTNFVLPRLALDTTEVGNTNPFSSLRASSADSAQVQDSIGSDTVNTIGNTIDPATISTNIGTEQSFFGTVANLNANSTTEVNIVAPSGSKLIISYIAPETVGATLIDPNGNVVATNSIGTPEAQLPIRFFDIQNPIVGNYKLRLEQQAGTDDVIPVVASIVGNPLNLTLNISQPDAENTSQITATLNNAGVPVTGATLQANISGIDVDYQQNLTLFDDGQHGDGQADDGVYSAKTDPLTGGPYTVAVFAQGADFQRFTSDILVTKEPDRANLSLQQIELLDTGVVGDNISYTFVASNIGPKTATGIKLVNTLPQGVEFVSASVGATYDPNTRTVTFDLGNLDVEGSTTANVVVKRTVAGGLKSVATLTANELDPDLSNNTLETTGNDLQLTRQSNQTNVGIGQNYAYSLTIKNNGVDEATGVTLTEQLPPELEFISSPGQSPTNTAGNLFFDLGNIPSGESKTVTLIVKSSVAGKSIILTNVDSSNDDYNTVNNTLTTSIPVKSSSSKSADLELSQSVSNISPSVGENISLVLTLTNKGIDVANQVQVKDLLPSDLEFVSATPEQGTYNNSTGFWDVGNISQNLSKTLTITAQVKTATQIKNTAEVFAVSEADPDSVPNNNNPAEDDQSSVILGGNTINDEPSGADNAVTTATNTTYIFTAQDFNFSDPKDIPANNLLAVKITTLPTNGSLTNKGTIVNAGDSISATDIAAGNLQFTPATDTKGLNYANSTFQVQDDGGTANGGIDLDQTPNTITINVGSSGGSTGDPHILTFDNLHYDFQATGDFILVKAQDSDLEIQVRQAPWDQNPATTLNVGLATTVDGQQLEFSIKQPFPLLNGIPIALEPGETQAISNGSISRTPTDGYGTLGDLYTITYPNGDRLFANVYPNFVIDPTVHLKGSQAVVGLLGNNNGQIEDDLALQDGTVSPQAATPEYFLSEFAASWQVQPEDSLFRDQALPANSKLVTGTAGNDTLTGSESNDILFRTLTSQPNPGLGEIDQLTGYQGADTFVLGNTNSTFYNGTGMNDYALIQDFNIQDGDIIQLKGDVNDYVLGSASTQQGSGTGIFLASDPTELIGIVKGIEPQDLLLTQKSFQYI